MKAVRGGGEEKRFFAVLFHTQKGGHPQTHRSVSSTSVCYTHTSESHSSATLLKQIPVHQSKTDIHRCELRRATAEENTITFCVLYRIV